MTGGSETARGSVGWVDRVSFRRTPLRYPHSSAMPTPTLTLDQCNRRGAGTLPGEFGIEFDSIEWTRLTSRLAIRPQFLAPNGYLHAATVIALADTTCGYGCISHLPEGADGFTTAELKSNFLSTTTDGVILCEAIATHLGRTTQVWDAIVSSAETGRKMALFRCTQVILYRR